MRNGRHRRIERHDNHENSYVWFFWFAYFCGWFSSFTAYGAPLSPELLHKPLRLQSEALLKTFIRFIFTMFYKSVHIYKTSIIQLTSFLQKSTFRLRSSSMGLLHKVTPTKVALAGSLATSYIIAMTDSIGLLSAMKNENG